MFGLVVLLIRIFIGVYCDCLLFILLLSIINFLLYLIFLYDDKLVYYGVFFVFIYNFLNVMINFFFSCNYVNLY